MEASSASLTGSGRFERIARFGFPTEILIGEDGEIARLGRDGPVRILFGRGRRVRLADDTEWRIKAATSGKYIVPLIKSSTGTIAISSPLSARRSYGINGHGYGLALIPLGKIGMRIPASWVLRRYEQEVATIDFHERTISAPEPLPAAAAILAFTLITHGIPGEADLVPGGDSGL